MKADLEGLGSIEKPEELYNIIERFCNGRCASHGTKVVLTVRALVERGRCNGRYTPTRGMAFSHAVVEQWFNTIGVQTGLVNGWTGHAHLLICCCQSLGWWCNWCNLWTGLPVMCLK